MNEDQQAPSGEARHGAPRPQEHHPRRGHRSFWRELPAIAVLALVISVLVKTFLVQAFFIPSGSMENTLRVSDRVLVNKLADSPPEIHRGDVVVFRDPGGWLDPQPDGRGPMHYVRRGLELVGLAPAPGDEDLIKRVIGVGGDTVACEGNGAPLTVNGAPLDEPYLFPGEVPSLEAFSVTVPKGSVWVMGDHRSVSEDSRAHLDQRGGFVPVDHVLGRAVVVIWPLDRAGGLEHPATFRDVPAA